MKPLALSAAAIVLALTGCATSPAFPNKRDPHSLLVWSEGSATSIRRDAGRVTGPGIFMDETAEGFRGQAFGRAVDLKVTDSQVTGALGPGATQLFLRSDTDGLALRGLLGGVLSHLRISSEAIEGNVGRCSYSLKAVPSGYSGYRQCVMSGPRQLAFVSLPEGIEVQSSARDAALLAVMLAQ